MKKIILMASLFIVTQGYAQTKQYVKIEITKFKGEKISQKTTKYEGGTIDIDGTSLTIDKEAPKPKYFTLVSSGKRENDDEGYYSVQYLAVTENSKGDPKAVKCLYIYTPKNKLCDVIIKSGHQNTDYCLTDK